MAITPISLPSSFFLRRSPSAGIYSSCSQGSVFSSPFSASASSLHVKHQALGEIHGDLHSHIRGRGPPPRRGRSSSYSSSPSPRRAPRRTSRSRSPRRPMRGRSPSSSSTSSSPPRKR